MAQVQGHYRHINGKVVFVHEHDNGKGEGRAAELHERTVIGKHKSGSFYLRASDAADGKQIEEAAKATGVAIQKKQRQGANHHGRTGAYDHYHFENAGDAAKVHAHMKGLAGKGAEKTESPSEKAERLTNWAHQEGGITNHKLAASAHMEAQDAESDAEKRGHHSKMADYHFAEAEKAQKGIDAKDPDKPQDGKGFKAADKEQSSAPEEPVTVQAATPEKGFKIPPKPKAMPGAPEGQQDHPEVAKAKAKTWGGALPHGDMRGILDKGSLRKSESWGETANDKGSHIKGSDAEIGALKHLYEKHGVHNAGASPMHDIKGHKGAGEDGKAPMEHIQKDAQGRHFYVNTEGYDYPRYTRHIPDEVMEKVLGKKPTPDTMEEANTQAASKKIEEQKGKVGGDKTAMAALEMRQQKLAGESSPKEEVKAPLKADHPAAQAWAHAKKAPKVGYHADDVNHYGKKIHTDSHKATQDAHKASIAAEHSDSHDDHLAAANAHFLAAAVHENAQKKKGAMYMSDHSNAQDAHLDAAAYHNKKANKPAETAKPSTDLHQKASEASEKALEGGSASSSRAHSFTVEAHKATESGDHAKAHEAHKKASIEHQNAAIDAIKAGNDEKVGQHMEAMKAHQKAAEHHGNAQKKG